MHATNHRNRAPSRAPPVRPLPSAVLGLAIAALVGCSASSKSIDASLETVAAPQDRAPATSFAADRGDGNGRAMIGHLGGKSRLPTTNWLVTALVVVVR